MQRLAAARDWDQISEKAGETLLLFLIQISAIFSHILDTVYYDAGVKRSQLTFVTC